MNIAKTISILVATSIAVFIAVSFEAFIPSGRGIVGGGIYNSVNEFRFYELAFFTALAVYLVSRKSLKLKHAAAFTSGVGLGLLNVALLIVDFRSATYKQSIETIGSSAISVGSANSGNSVSV